MSTYRKLFKKYNLKVAQILLTAEDLSNRAAYLHICDVLEMVLQLGIVPIINENDVTSTDELIPVTKGYEVNFSDNDILSVLVANALEANLIINLSNVDGLYTMNPKKRGAKLIKTIEKTYELSKEIRILREILPICANCKKIRKDTGYWENVEQYIEEHSSSKLSHGICPDCYKKLYPEFAKKSIKKDRK